MNAEPVIVDWPLKLVGVENLPVQERVVGSWVTLGLGPIPEDEMKRLIADGRTVLARVEHEGRTMLEIVCEAAVLFPAFAPPKPGTARIQPAPPGVPNPAITLQDMLKVPGARSYDRTDEHGHRFTVVTNAPDSTDAELDEAMRTARSWGWQV